jgi:cytochrome b subunit of formate dehydrogenase
MSDKQPGDPSRTDGAFADAAKAAIWIGVLVTAAVCVTGWAGGVAWILWARGAAHLVDYTSEIFVVSAASLFCAVVATLSALVALRWKDELLAAPELGERVSVEPGGAPNARSASPAAFPVAPTASPMVPAE